MAARIRKTLVRSGVAGAVTGITLLASAGLPAAALACDKSGAVGGTQPSAHREHDGNGSLEKPSDDKGGSDHGHNPGGDNGTVKIHDVAGDHRTHDVSHVACTWFVDFFGFDDNQQAEITFTGQAPTGKGTVLYDSGTITVSPDQAGGAANDWDSELAFTAEKGGAGTYVDLSRLGAPQPQQGYHVKLTVRTFQPGDNGVKHKVFWVRPCSTGGVASGATGSASGATGGATGSASGSTGSATGSTGSATGGTEVSGVTQHRPVTEVLGESFHRTPTAAGGPATEVLGMSLTRSLPFTGAPTGALLGAAGAVLTLGVGLTVAARRRSETGA